MCGAGDERSGHLSLPTLVFLPLRLGHAAAPGLPLDPARASAHLQRLVAVAPRVQVALLHPVHLGDHLGHTQCTPHTVRAPSTRCTADLVHHAWHRRSPVCYCLLLAQEITSVLDWTVAATSLDLLTYLQLEDIYVGLRPTHSALPRIACTLPSAHYTDPEHRVCRTGRPLPHAHGALLP